MGVECLKLQIKITTYYLIYNDFFFHSIINCTLTYYILV